MNSFKKNQQSKIKMIRRYIIEMQHKKKKKTRKKKKRKVGKCKINYKNTKINKHLTLESICINLKGEKTNSKRSKYFSLCLAK